MRNFLEDHKRLLALLGATLLIAIVIGMFAALKSGDKTSAAEQGLEAIAAPGQTAVSGVGGWIRNFFGHFGNVKALREENESLKQENIALDKRLRDAQGLEQENEELRAMLNLTETEGDMDLLAAPVSAKDPSNWYGTFTIGRGSDQGIQIGQAVLTANEELIGKITRVGANWAEVMTVLNPECGVGSLIERSKDTGVLEGDFTLRLQRRCRLNYLSRDAAVETGDYVETSGMGGVYPKGLLVGKVLEVKEDNTNMSKYAIVEPMVNFGKLNQVFVLLNQVSVVRRRAVLGTGQSESGEHGDGSGSGDENGNGNEPSSSASPRPSASASPRQSTAPRASASPTSRPSSGTSTGSGTSGSSGSAGSSGGSSGSGSSSGTGSTGGSGSSGASGATGSSGSAGTSGGMGLRE